MLNPLFIQLFGRELIDRLARAGFGTTAQLAQANAERMSAETGIPIFEARRVIALALEDHALPETKPAAPSPRAKVQKTKGVNPYVDDAGLIAWMGSNLTVGSGRSPRFSVTDAILDPHSAALPIMKEFVKGRSRQDPVRPKTPKRTIVTLEGAFWSFGSGPAGHPTKQPAGPDPEKSVPAGDASEGRLRRKGDLFTPRKRGHDGH